MRWPKFGIHTRQKKRAKQNKIEIANRSIETKSKGKKTLNKTPEEKKHTWKGGVIKIQKFNWQISWVECVKSNVYTNITCVYSLSTFMQTNRETVIYMHSVLSLSLSLSLARFVLFFKSFVMPTRRSKRKNLSIIVIDGFKGNVLVREVISHILGTQLDITTNCRLIHTYTQCTHLRIHLTYTH